MNENNVSPKKNFNRIEATLPPDKVGTPRQGQGKNRH
jgi:hypothetical protein